MKAIKLKTRKPDKVVKNDIGEKKEKKKEKEIVAEKDQIEMVVKEPTKKFKRLKKVTSKPPVINYKLFANAAAIYQERA